MNAPPPPWEAWHVARLPVHEITLLTMLLQDQWEPFGADGPYLYLRHKGEPRSVPNAAALTIVPRVY